MRKRNIKSILFAAFATATVFTTVLASQKAYAATAVASSIVCSDKTITGYSYNVNTPAGTDLAYIIYKPDCSSVIKAAGAQIKYDMAGIPYVCPKDRSKLSTKSKKVTCTWKQLFKKYGEEYAIGTGSFEPGTYNIAWISINTDAYTAAKAEAAENKTDKSVVSIDDRNEDGSFKYFQVVYSGEIVSEAGTCETALTVSKNSIMLNFSQNSRITGYEIYRKSADKYTKIFTTTSAYYNDEGLSKGKKYEYKIVPYYLGADGTVKYGEADYAQATTIGESLNVKATVSGSKVKLKWNKVEDAKNYRIYRVETSSQSSVVADNGVGNSFNAATLVATLKKSKRNYEDKKLKDGEKYYYYVEAVLENAKGKEVVVRESIKVDMSFAGISSFVDSGYTADGSYRVSWDKVEKADGYKVYKKDNITGAYFEVQTLDKNASSYTAPRLVYNSADANSLSAQYKIVPFAGNRITGGKTFSYGPVLPAVTGVTASVEGDSIRVNWNAVPGASFYKVFRIKAGKNVLNKATGLYSYKGTDDSAVTQYNNVVGLEVNPGYKKFTGYYQNYSYSNTYTWNTTILDTAATIADSNNATGKVVGPKAGFEYQYYVVAYYDESFNAEESISKDYYDTLTKTVKTGSIYTYILDSVKSDCSSEGLVGSVSNTVTYTKTVAGAKPAIKSIKTTKKGAVEITLKKKAAAYGASEIKIYRSTSKKGKYTVVGTTTKNKFVDKTAESGKKYFYKAVSVVKGEACADVESAASKAVSNASKTKKAKKRK